MSCSAVAVIAFTLISRLVAVDVSGGGDPEVILTSESIFLNPSYSQILPYSVFGSSLVGLQGEVFGGANLKYFHFSVGNPAFLFENSDIMEVMTEKMPETPVLPTFKAQGGFSLNIGNTILLGASVGFGKGKETIEVFQGKIQKETNSLLGIIGGILKKGKLLIDFTLSAEENSTFYVSKDRFKDAYLANFSPRLKMIYDKSGLYTKLYIFDFSEISRLSFRRSKVGFSSGVFTEIGKLLFSVRAGKIFSYFAQIHASSQVPLGNVSVLLGFVETLSFDRENIFFSHSPRIGVLSRIKKYVIGISTRVEKFPKFILLSIEIFL